MTPSPGPPLELALSWCAGGRWYHLHAGCGAGLTALQGPAARMLLRLLAGYPVRHEGSARLDGRPLRHGEELIRHGPQVRPIAAVLGEVLSQPWRTPLGLADGVVRAQGVPHPEARSRAAQALRWVGATDLGRRPLATLDAAGRRRAALAAALAAVPGLLLLDRPCAPLPSREHAGVYAMLQERALAWEMVVLLIPDETGRPLPALHLGPILEDPSQP